MRIKSWLKNLFPLVLLILGLPLLGVYPAGIPVSRYLEFPPKTRYVYHTPFSWVFFIAYSLCILTVTGPFILRIIRCRKETKARPCVTGISSFPWWGWMGLGLGGISWLMAWSRFPWFAWFQAHTFTPLWISYIITMNALTYQRTGYCLLTDHPRLLFLLFPISAGFWWFFEYLNRFVQNWYYVGADFGPMGYFIFATFPFSTVLPGVASTKEWIKSLSFLKKNFGRFIVIDPPSPRLLATAPLIVATFGLTEIGVYPDLLFPLLWISPLLIIVSTQTILNEDHIFSDLRTGDRSNVLSWAIAAMICGFFWEMWNHYSFAKWRYSIPFVHRFHVFEMPILGYAGYLSFGLECGAVIELVKGRV